MLLVDRFSIKRNKHIEEKNGKKEIRNREGATQMQIKRRST